MKATPAIFMYFRKSTRAVASAICALSVAVMSLSSAEETDAHQPGAAVRAQASEALTVAGGAKAAVTEYFSDHGRFPLNNEKAGLDEPYMIVGSYIVSVTVTDGTISVVFGSSALPEIYAHTLEFVPELVDGGISWTCASYTLPDRFLPRACQKGK